jgi:hypothetical protein
MVFDVLLHFINIVYLLLQRVVCHITFLKFVVSLWMGDCDMSCCGKASRLMSGSQPQGSIALKRANCPI